MQMYYNCISIAAHFATIFKYYVFFTFLCVQLYIHVVLIFALFEKQ